MHRLTSASAAAFAVLLSADSFSALSFSAASSQGLTLVHYSAQLEPFLTQKHTRNTPSYPLPTPTTTEATPNCAPCHTEGASVEPKSGRV